MGIGGGNEKRQVIIGAVLLARGELETFVNTRACVWGAGSCSSPQTTHKRGGRFHPIGMSPLTDRTITNNNTPDPPP